MKKLIIFTHTEIEDLNKYIFQFLTTKQVNEYLDRFEISMEFSPSASEDIANTDLKNAQKIYSVLGKNGATQYDIDTIPTLAFYKACFDKSSFYNFSVTNDINKALFEKAFKKYNAILKRFDLKLIEEGTYSFRKENTPHKILARRFKARNIHPIIEKACFKQFLNDEHNSAILEACNEILEKISNKSKLPKKDALHLINLVFREDLPIIKINGFKTKSEKNEQWGFHKFLLGMFQMFRNPAAHESKSSWKWDENDAFDFLSMASFIVRKLQSSKVDEDNLKAAEKK